MIKVHAMYGSSIYETYINSENIHQMWRPDGAEVTFLCLAHERIVRVTETTEEIMRLIEEAKRWTVLS